VDSHSSRLGWAQVWVQNFPEIDKGQTIFTENKQVSALVPPGIRA